MDNKTDSVLIEQQCILKCLNCFCFRKLLDCCKIMSAG